MTTEEILKQEAERKYPSVDDENHFWIQSLKREGYIAGALSRSGGVWVKASDKLPETDGMVFIRNITTRHGGMIHTNELAKMENLFNVEWLSESPAADKGDAIADKEKERLYWQQRCEAAETYLIAMENWFKKELSLEGFDKFSKSYDYWQQLKDQKPKEE